MLISHWKGAILGTDMGQPIITNGEFVALLCHKLPLWVVRPRNSALDGVYITGGPEANLRNFLSINYYGVFHCVVGKNVLDSCERI